jgi:DNA-binding MarR family transcriptional regulator
MAKKKKYEVSEDSPGVLLWLISQNWQKVISQRFEELNLTYTQYLLLNGLKELQSKQEETTQTILSGHTGVDVMMTSQLLRKLESKGYVKRKNHEIDSRAKKISLTKKGTDSVQECLKVLEEVDSQFFSSVKDLDKFTSSLKSIQEN